MSNTPTYNRSFRIHVQAALQSAAARGDLLRPVLIAVKAGDGEVCDYVATAVALRFTMFQRRPDRPRLRKRAAAIAAAIILRLRQAYSKPSSILAIQRHAEADSVGQLTPAFHPELPVCYRPIADVHRA